MNGKNNKAHNTTQQEPVYHDSYQDDEIDLRELIKVIWD
jgi:hypothetical protein